MTAVISWFKKHAMLVGCLGGILLACIQQCEANPEANPTDKVTDLRQERLAVLEEIQQAVEQWYEQGRGRFEQLYQARMEVLKARLDLAETLQDRVGIYEQMVKLAEDNHKIKSKLAEHAADTSPY